MLHYFREGNKLKDRTKEYKKCVICKKVLPINNFKCYTLWYINENVDGEYIINSSRFCKKCDNLKLCASCGKYKNKSEFYDTHRCYCIRCTKLYYKWKRENRGRVKLFDNPFDCETQWHHISDGFILAIPKILHYKYSFEYKHRENLKDEVQELYNISYIVIENGKVIN